MKAAIKDTGFVPVVITLTIESEAELCGLWHRVNVRGSVIESDSNNERVPLVGISSPVPLWDALNREIIARGIKK
jgi:hypothetical protein